MTIESIPRYKSDREEEAFKFLNDVTEELKKSGVISVAILAETGDGEILTGCWKSPDTDVWRMIGILESLKAEMLLDLDHTVRRKVSDLAMEP